MKNNPREITVLALVDTLEKGEYSHIVLKNVLDKYGFLEARDRHFISRLFKGTIEKKITLDYIIDLYSKTKVAKQKPFIRTLMRASAYQIVFMDGIPGSAAVNEAVKIAKTHGFSSLSGFVNGVLRNVVKGMPYDFDEMGVSDSVKYSVPQWIIDKWNEEYFAGSNDTNKQLTAMFDGFSAERPLCVRVNPNIGRNTVMKALLNERVTVATSMECQSALLLKDYDRIDALESFKTGMYYVQDLTSQMMIDIAGIKAGDNVVDVCAAPGGKAIAAATIVGENGHVEARDLSESKCDVIRENVRRMGLSNISVKARDARLKDVDLVDKADVVICDAPCSGLGVIGRKPDIRYRVTPEDVESLAQLQNEILSTVCSYVKKGGKLVYSTCTISKAENQNQVATFKETHPEFSVVQEKQFFITDTHDGFYVCVMQRV